LDLANPILFRSIISGDATVEYRFGIPSVRSIFVHPGIFGWCMAFFACFSFAFFTIFEKNRYLIFTILFALGAVLSMRFKPIGGLVTAVFVAAILIKGGKKIPLWFGPRYFWGVDSDT